MDLPSGSGLTVSQEAYDGISTIYEKSMTSHYEHVQKILDRLTSTFLEPRSNILDAGSGTGKPIAAHFADNGHVVTGIDYSPGMISLARSQVPNATFLQVEMTSWEPSAPHSYDMIIASHSLYVLSVAQIRTMLYKFTQWVKKGGIVIIGTSYNQGTLDKQGEAFDHRGWVEGFPDTFLGRFFGSTTYGREDAWVNLIKEIGLEIIDVDRAICLKENDPDPDVQYYIIARAVQDNYLIGPFPVPTTFSGVIDAQSNAWAELKERSDIDEINGAAFEALRKEPPCRKVLCVTKFIASLQVPGASGIEFQPTSELPDPNILPGSVDGVLFPWILHTVSAPGQYLDHALKAISPTGRVRFVVIQPAPDHELTNMYNVVSQGLNLPIQHHGYLLKEAEDKFRAAGFQNISYIRKQGFINFGPVQDGRIKTAALSLSKLYVADRNLQVELEERLKKLLKVHFLHKPSGEIACPTIILVAERD